MNKKNPLIITALIMLILLTATGTYTNRHKNQIKGAKTENINTKEIRGIILPHHNFAKEIIMKSYEKLKAESYDIIVLMGPNHFYPETTNLIIPDSKSFASISEENLQYILDNVPNVIVDSDIVLKEHSITTQITYINQYFPGAKILPVIIPEKNCDKDTNLLVDILSKLPNRALYIASVDFAHDIKYIEALENNEESILAIRSFNLPIIETFDNKHMDSPKSIVILLKIMQKIGSTNFELLYNTHQAIIANSPDLIGTGYVIGVFR